MRTLFSSFGRSIALGLALIPAIAVPAFSAAGPAHRQEGTPAKKQTNNNAAPATAQSTGEQKFNQNCGRCHRSPEGFSPRISGTILKHMRVRASLSQQDEREILHFLNP